MDDIDTPSEGPTPAVAFTEHARVHRAPVPPGFDKSAGRIEDLVAQIDFLDNEVKRYRNLLESERIRHTQAIADHTVVSDAALDALRRAEQADIDKLHATYRALLSERQVSFEQSLSEQAREHADALAQEQLRHEENLERERTRRDVEVEAARQRMSDEMLEQSNLIRQAAHHEAARTEVAIAALQDALTAAEERAEAALAKVATRSNQVPALERRLAAAVRDRDRRVAALEKRAEHAERKLSEERARAAATLAELLERSATIAAEVDTTRAQQAAQSSTADHALVAHQHQAQQDYEALAHAADERARLASVRESELEVAIADLRSQLNQ